MTVRRVTMVLCIVAALLAAVFRDNPLNRAAQNYAQTVAVTAAATYVTLRTLNAFLSTAEEVEVGLSFIASGSAQPLKVLEPIDDTIERVAGLVFGVMVATSILAVAIGPISAIGFAMLAFALILKLAPQRNMSLSRPMLWYGAFLGLAMPLALASSAIVATTLTETTYQTNLSVITEITATVGDTSIANESEPGLREYRALANNVWARADELISALIAVLGVYVFRIFLLPLLLIGAMLIAARHLARESS